MSEEAIPNKERIGPALGKLPSGIYVTTAVFPDGKPIGMLASFIEQAGFVPPAVMIAIANDRPILTALKEGSGKIGINVLGKENGTLVGLFAKHREESFAGLNLVENSYGLPQLGDALAFLACKMTGTLEAGDHTVVVAEVLDGILQKTGSEPMVRVRPNGFGY